MNCRTFPKYKNETRCIVDTYSNRRAKHSVAMPGTFIEGYRPGGLSVPQWGPGTKPRYGVWGMQFANTVYRF